LNSSNAKEALQDTSLENGLETQEVQKRRVKYGFNEVPDKKVRFIARLGKRFWGIVPSYTLFVTFVINDPVKVYLTRKFRANPSESSKRGFHVSKTEV
jgi:hypothetical protein